MTTAEIIEKLASEVLPPTAMNARRLFGSFSLGILPKPVPLSLLPNELLSEIFLFTKQYAKDRADAISMPIVVSQVSTRWRNVAISTGGLWNIIIITFPTSRQQLSRAITWLKRSRSSPLDIFLDFRDPSWDWDVAEYLHTFRWQDMEAILRLLMTHADRWKRFELLTDTWAPIFTFLCYTRRAKSLHTLESLSLHRCNAFFASKGALFAPIEMKQPVPLFGGRVAENLRRVTLTGVHVDWAASPLRNLTKLKLRYLASDVRPSMDEFTTIMTGCRHLRHLTIIGRGPRIDGTRDTGTLSPTEAGTDNASPKLPSVIELPHVTEFVFGFIDTEYAVRLLARLSFPTIRRLTLEGLVGLNPLVPVPHDLEATPVLKRLITHDTPSKETSRSPIPLCRISSLNLISIKADTSTFSRFFDDLHELKYLGLHRMKDDAINALAQPVFGSSSSLPPCATLTTLECHDMNPMTLLDFMIARSKLPQLAHASFRSDELCAENRNKLLDAGIEILHDFAENATEHEN
ncbi:hypothetical protein H0H87_004934 [Tephrocybe sp. NHM501043]|nr:hypothetical protein H0H87_004934 [Tephrocybe sp. NHM501043]